MVLQLLSVRCEMGNIESVTFPEDHEWVLDVEISGSGDVRSNVKLTNSEEVDIPNSRGTANLVLKVDKNVYATLKIESIPKTTQLTITESDVEKAKDGFVSLLAVECRGCSIKSWKPTGYYEAKSCGGTIFREVDLSEGEWYDVDCDTNEPVSITNVVSRVDVCKNPLPMEKPISSQVWIEENYASLCPPICNKLMHKSGLSVMFVGGPNSRTDFHVDESSEFFFQLKGNMNLPIIERGMKRIVHIKEGEVFLLPSRVPHSPQRPEAGSVGLVIERRRNIGEEFDCLRWYTDHSECDKVQYEQFFACEDLGKDLMPVVKDYKEFLTSKNGEGFVRADTPLIQDEAECDVPNPFRLDKWLADREWVLEKGVTLPLFEESHPDKEFLAVVSTETGNIIDAASFEVFMFQINGTVDIVNCHTGESHKLEATGCFVLSAGSAWRFVKRSECSRTLVLYCDPLGNKKM